MFMMSFMEYTIAEVAEKTGLTAYSLRFYENKGIIPKAGRNGAGYRVYGETEMSAIMLFLCLKSAGMSLNDIREYYRLTEQGNETLHERLDLLRSTLGNIEARQEELERCRFYALDKIRYYEQCCDEYDRGLPVSAYKCHEVKKIFGVKA